jgi:hypothetical protein
MGRHEDLDSIRLWPNVDRGTDIGRARSGRVPARRTGAAGKQRDIPSANNAARKGTGREASILGADRNASSSDRPCQR